MKRCAVLFGLVIGLSSLIAPALSRADDKDKDKVQRHEVAMKGMKYEPDKLEVAAGDTVVWTNQDDRDHTVVAKDGSFKSGNISRGESFKYQFKKAGTFAYACSLHPRMKGTVVVKGG
jgi:plastocyanin